MTVISVVPPEIIVCRTPPRIVVFVEMIFVDSVELLSGEGWIDDVGAAGIAEWLAGSALLLVVGVKDVVVGCSIAVGVECCLKSTINSLMDIWGKQRS